MENDFPGRLRRLRERRKPLLSIKVTAELIGLHPDALRRYERGERDPGRKALIAMADYYNVTLDELCGYSKKNL